jgi:hypothetical protein
MDKQFLIHVGIEIFILVVLVIYIYISNSRHDSSTSLLMERFNEQTNVLIKHDQALQSLLQGGGGVQPQFQPQIPQPFPAQPSNPKPKPNPKQKSNIDSEQFVPKIITPPKNVFIRVEETVIKPMPKQHNTAEVTEVHTDSEQEDDIDSIDAEISKEIKEIH